MSAHVANQASGPPERWWDKLPRSAYAQFERVATPEEWFEVYRISADVYVFYEPGQYEEAIANLVIGQQRAALIDTGCGIGNLRRAVETVTTLPVLVVNTHTHTDHLGGNPLFAEIAMFDHPLARAVSTQGVPHSEMAHLLAPGMVWHPLPPDFVPESYHIPPFKVSRWLRDGDVIDLGNRRLEVIYTPGEAPDHICLLDRQARLLWIGDLFCTGSIFAHLPGSDLQAFIQSYRRLMRYYDQFDRLMPSHNEPWLEKAHLEEVLQAMEEIVAGRGSYIETTDPWNTPIRAYTYPRFTVFTPAG